MLLFYSIALFVVIVLMLNILFTYAAFSRKEEHMRVCAKYASLIPFAIFNLFFVYLQEPFGIYLTIILAIVFIIWTAILYWIMRKAISRYRRTAKAAKNKYKRGNGRRRTSYTTSTTKKKKRGRPRSK